MAHEEEVGEVITISDTSNFSEDISSFYLKRKFSDVTLVFEGQSVYAELYAHKVILASRCKYFESLLACDESLSKVVIKDVSPNVFKKILGYIYTGSISFRTSQTDLIFEVMKLASGYSLQNLEKAISEKISSVIDIDNVFDILNKANEFGMDGLRQVCHTFMDKRPTEILESEYLLNLTQKSMVKLLERDSFGAPEIEIFQSVAKWCRKNKDDNGLVIQCVRLSCLTNEEILSTVYPTKLIDSDKLLALMARSVDEKPKLSNYSGVLNTDENKNFASIQNGAKVLSRIDTSFLLNGNNNVDRYAYHDIGDEDGITVKLKAPSYINHIYMRLRDNEPWIYSYNIEVSLNQRKWLKIIDYSNYHCRSYQNLYFDKVLVQYIRITSISRYMFLLDFKCFLTTYCDQATVNGIVRPSENVALPNKGAIVIQGENGNNLLQNNINAFAITASGTIDPSPAIVVQLAQPYLISSMKFFLPKNEPSGYIVETSLDKLQWQIAVDHANRWCSSWQDLQFEERVVVFIKIKMMGSLLQFRRPFGVSLSDPVQPSGPYGNPVQSCSLNDISRHPNEVMRCACFECPSSTIH